MRARISLTCDSTANWMETNPILLAGEAAVELAAQGKVMLKIGDGVHHWRDLAYQGSDVQAILDLISANTEAIELNSRNISALDETINGEGGIGERLSTAEQDIESLAGDIEEIKFYNHNIAIHNGSNGDFYFTVVSSRSTPFTSPVQVITQGETRAANGIILDNEDNYIVVTFHRTENDVFEFTGYENGRSIVATLDMSDPNYTFNDAVGEIL